MVEQEARVITVEGDQLTLETETKSSCNACEVKSGCGTSVLSKWVGRKFTRFHAKNTVNARVGDQVVVGLSEAALVQGSLAIYFLPLLGMIVFALAADILVPRGSDGHDLIVAVAGFAGFGAALGVCRHFLARDRLKEELTPVVLRKVIEHGRISP
jgi:sigma-E factor negative regulatory protein RseC